MKKYVIGMLAVLLAVIATAFTPKNATHAFKKSHKSTEYFYVYNLSTVVGQNAASNYSFINPQPAGADEVSGCTGTSIPCVILATGTSGIGGMPNASEVSSANLPGNTETKKAVH